MDKRKYGINIASLFPWSLGPGGPRRAWAIAQEAGFDGLQILPLRGWGRPEETVPSQSVLSFEGAWKTGRLDHPHPTIKDWLLFGASRERCHQWTLSAARHFKAAIFSQQTIGGWHAQPIEIHPELELSLDQYRAYPGGLVWDTRHVRRPSRNDQARPVTDNWREFLWSLPGKQIRLIHLNLNGEEIQSLLYCSVSEIGEMCRFLHRQTCDGCCPVILELEPKLFGSRRKLASELAGLRGVLANDYFS